MPGLILGAALAAGLCAGAQAPQTPPAVFHVDVYVVPIEMTFSRRSFRGDKKPLVDLTVADFTITLEKKTYVPVRVEPDKSVPGRYLVIFSPPEELRDGKEHQVEVKLKKWRMKMTVTFPKPVRETPVP